MAELQLNMWYKYYGQVKIFSSFVVPVPGVGFRWKQF
jgi:hypothetical protein